MIGLGSGSRTTAAEFALALMLIGCAHAPVTSVPPDNGPFTITSECFADSAWDVISTVGTLRIDHFIFSFRPDPGAPGGGSALHVDMTYGVSQGIAWEIIGQSGGTPDVYDLRIRLSGWISRAVSSCPGHARSRLIFIGDFEAIPASEEG